MMMLERDDETENEASEWVENKQQTKKTAAFIARPPMKTVLCVDDMTMGDRFHGIANKIDDVDWAN